MFLSALVAFWGMWRWILVNLGLFVLGTVQIFLILPDDDPASGARPALCLFVLVYAAYIAHRDMRWLGLRGTPPGEPAVATRTADPV